MSAATSPETKDREVSPFDRKVERLTAISEDNFADAYDDVPWDEPGFELDPTDPRLELFSFDPLRRTDWYQQLEPTERARVGLRRVAGNLRVGWEFENLLQQGLLVRAFRMGNSEAEFRYVHQEVAEESQHSMMFYEFVRRYAPEVSGMPRVLKSTANPPVQIACRRYPALFFFMVLGGEIPVDHIQRQVLKQENVHPLVHRIMAIHVEEEARHVGYANLELRRRVPQMTPRGRRGLARVLPEVMGLMARLMVYPTPWQVSYEDVPRDDLKAAYRSPETGQLLADSVARIRNLCVELDLLTPASVQAWKRNRIWDEPKRRAKTAA